MAREQSMLHASNVNQARATRNAMNVAEEQQQELDTSKIILARTERQVEEEKLLRDPILRESEALREKVLLLTREKKNVVLAFHVQNDEIEMLKKKLKKDEIAKKIQDDDFKEKLLTTENIVSQLQVNCLTLTEEVVGKEVVADELKDLLDEQRERHLKIDQRWSTKKKEVREILLNDCYFYFFFLFFFFPSRIITLT